MELIIQGLSEKSQPVTVQPTATIGHLKQLIAPHFETTASRLNLSALGGQILDKDQLTVSQYGLSSGSTVMLLISTTPVSFQMFVKNVSGQTKMYDITEDETVDQLKTKVYQKEGTPEDQQRLVFNGKQLDSGRKLQDYGITSGSTIYLTLRLRGG